MRASRACTMLSVVTVTLCSNPLALCRGLLQRGAAPSCSGPSPSSTLCAGIVAMHKNATCKQLADVEFVADVIRGIGLYRDPRGVAFYGVESVHQTNLVKGGPLPSWQNKGEHATYEGSYDNYNGIWQDPVQLASALVFLARRGEAIETYLEVGVWTGWTHSFICAYLSLTCTRSPRVRGARLGRDGGIGTSMSMRGGFNAYAVDVSDLRMDATTQGLMRQLGSRYVHRDNVTQLRPMTPAAAHASASTSTARRETTSTSTASAPWGGAASSDVFSLCFLDAVHKFRDALADLSQFAPHCRIVFFHDIVEFNSFKEQGGGMPHLWSWIVRLAGRKRVAEFTQQAGVYPPNMGIGMLLPNAEGTAHVPGLEQARRLTPRAQQAKGIFGQPKVYGSEAWRYGRTFQFKT